MPCDTMPPAFRTGRDAHVSGHRPVWTRRGVPAVALGLVASRPGAGRATGSVLTLAGNGGAMGAMRRLAEAYRVREPALEVRFLPNLGTSGGINAALEGTIGVALAARPANERERTAGARSVAYARTPFAFAVDPAVSVRDVTMAEVGRILSGEMVAWPDGTRIRPIRRPHNDTDTHLLATISPAMARSVELLMRRPGVTTAGNDQDNADALESVVGAFGAITLAQQQTERRRVALLALDGMPPSVAAMVAGRYTLAKTLHAVTRGAPAPVVAGFLDFVFGADGRDILAASGHEPISGAGAA